VTSEVSRGGKLTQAVTHHVFGDVNGHMSAAIMHSDGMTYHLGKDGARPAPGANHLLLTFGIHSFNFFQQFRVDERPFLKRSRHIFVPSSRLG
jgi:hypothetical protein